MSEAYKKFVRVYITIALMAAMFLLGVLTTVTVAYYWFRLNLDVHEKTKIDYSIKKLLKGQAPKKLRYWEITPRGRKEVIAVIYDR